MKADHKQILEDSMRYMMYLVQSLALSGHRIIVNGLVATVTGGKETGEVHVNKIVYLTPHIDNGIATCNQSF